MAALFYHLTHSSVEATLPMLLTRSLEAGWRVAVRLCDDARLARLDERLWLEPEDGFLPHGVAGREWESEQPILLTLGPFANGAQCVISLDGAEVTAQEAQEAKRVCILFDGNDPHSLQQARDQWKALTGAGVAAQYWSEESGRWQMKAER